MTASADKVQFLLENSLQQTLPLIKKGIFSQQQLRQIMLEREKHENKLYSATFKLSHFLKAIQFEYDLQRKRLFKINNDQIENVNPLFKKQAKTDFSIVKRIIKLWDRTMHKFRYRTYLWKQYLSFCIALKSKKHFYKALTNALRFLPFQLELWKIGIRYEVQIGKNKWKARKLIHKGLKFVPSGQKNILLTKQLIMFELEFVESLQMRQNIIKGQIQEGQNDMKFIMGDKEQQQEDSSENQGNILGANQQSQLLKLKEYHEVLFVALVDSIQKNYKSKKYFSNNVGLTAEQRCEQLCNSYLQFLAQLINNEQNELLRHILTETISKLKNYQLDLSGIKLEEKIEQEQIEIANKNEKQIEGQGEYQIEEEKKVNQNQIKQQTKEEKYATELLNKYQNTKSFDDKLFNKIIKQFCLKPHQLSIFLEPTLLNCLRESLSVLSKNDWLRVPLKGLNIIFSKINSNQTEISKQYSLYLTKQIQKINVSEYLCECDLLREIIRFNKNQKKIDENNKLFRSILINCKQNIQFVEKAKCLFTE